MRKKSSFIFNGLGFRGLVFWQAIVLFTLFAFYQSSVGHYFESALGYHFSFSLREKLGKSPPLSDRLKIYAFDDLAVNHLKKIDIPLEQWAQLIATFSKAKPKMLIIDKKFGLVPPGDDRAFFQSTLAKSAPVYVGAYTKPSGERAPLEQQSAVDLNRPEFALSLLAEPERKGAWLPILAHSAYGPDVNLSTAFARIGHINSDYVGKVDPLRRLSPSKAIPHLALLAADKLAVTNTHLELDGQTLSLDNDGLLPVNFPSSHELYARTRSLYPIFQMLGSDSYPQKVNAGDVVLILPLFFTGNADMGQTPLGTLPRGYIVAALINSVLTKQWLKPIKLEKEFLVLGAFIGATLGVFLAPMTFWLVLLSLCTTIFLFGFGLFCFFNLMLPWYFLALASLLAGLVFFSVKMAGQVRISQAYETALSGLVSHSSLRELIKNPKAISREASEQILTIMFVDMVSFSSMVEHEHPKTVFRRLKETLGHFSATVHAFGGIVDKTLGDGMLCFFGYHYIGGSTAENHADQALACAEQIQRSHVERSLERLAQGETLVPLRIGINSAKVYIGDLGNEERVDFTLIGEGVNFAQRLEAACSPFCILFSLATLHYSTQYQLGKAGLSAKKIRVKHHRKLVDVVEYQPFFAQMDTLKKAKDSYFSNYHQNSRAPRWPLDRNYQLVLATSFGLVPLLNFSKTGFAFRSAKPLSTKEVLSFALQSLDDKIQAYLQVEALPTIACEVQWQRADKNEFIYGVKILNLKEAECERVYQSLRNVVTKIF